MSRPGHEPGPLDPESSAPTMRLPHLHNKDNDTKLITNIIVVNYPRKKQRYPQLKLSDSINDENLHFVYASLHVEVRSAVFLWRNLPQKNSSGL